MGSKKKFELHQPLPEKVDTLEEFFTTRPSRMDANAYFEQMAIDVDDPLIRNTMTIGEIEELMAQKGTRTWFQKTTAQLPELDSSEPIL